jgi:hypothetical protein
MIDKKDSNLRTSHSIHLKLEFPLLLYYNKILETPHTTTIRILQ